MRELKRFRRNNNTCTCFRYQIKENSITESRDAAGEQKSEVRSQHVEKSKGKNKKNLPKFEGLLRVYKKTYIEIPKKILLKFEEHAVPTI
jgi:hypothetical protein